MNNYVKSDTGEPIRGLGDDTTTQQDINNWIQTAGGAVDLVRDVDAAFSSGESNPYGGDIRYGGSANVDFGSEPPPEENKIPGWAIGLGLVVLAGGIVWAVKS